MIHVFIGTKAQYIKMVPLLRLMDAEGVDYRLIDSGQHAELARRYRSEFGLREPDVELGGTGDVESIPQALLWALGLSRHLLSRRRLQEQVFGSRSGAPGVCVVHGDTPTTLLSVLMAKRSGLAVAHVESGLRTGRVLHPFPEEIMRIVVPRLSDVMFAPGPESAANLRRSRVRGRVVEQAGNTVLELMSGAVETAAAVEAGEAAAGPVIITLHRVENLHRHRRRETLVGLVASLAAGMPVRWVLHGPTERALAGEPRRRLEAAGVDLVPLAPRGEFLDMVAKAPFIITDGGSIQEECAALGVPTLLWCDRTGRPDGVGENVVVSHYDRGIVDEFLEDPQRYRRPSRLPEVSPSQQILAELDAWR